MFLIYPFIVCSARYFPWTLGKTKCFLLFAVRYIGNQGRSLLGYLGRNSLAIYVFSPLFVGASKFVELFFRFDSTMICYAIVATFFSIIASLGCSYLSDRLHLTRWLFYSERIYY